MKKEITLTRDDLNPQCKGKSIWEINAFDFKIDVNKIRKFHKVTFVDNVPARRMIVGNVCDYLILFDNISEDKFDEVLKTMKRKTKGNGGFGYYPKNKTKMSCTVFNVPTDSTFNVPSDTDESSTTRMTKMISEVYLIDPKMKIEMVETQRYGENVISIGSLEQYMVTIKNNRIRYFKADIKYKQLCKVNIKKTKVFREKNSKIKIEKEVKKLTREFKSAKGVTSK